MAYWFDPQLRRKVARADYYTYVQETKHPDRILPVHDFFYVLNGTLEVTIDGVSWELCADDSVVLPANRHHYGTRPSSDGTRCVFVHIEPEAGDTETNAQAVDIPVVVHAARSAAIEHLYSAAVSIFQNRGQRREEELSSVVGTMLYLLHEVAATQASHRDSIADAAHEIIIKNPDRIVHTQELAETLFVSSITLNKHFGAVYGVTVAQYQRLIRIERVKDDLVSNPDRTLHEIAINNGYTDEFHLGRVFKQECGITPGQFRKRHRGAEASSEIETQF